jgi:Domain of unknown function (DUF4082)/Bacterial Ig-like domain (group 1)
MRRIQALTLSLLACTLMPSMPVLGQAQTPEAIFNVASYGGNGADQASDADAIRAALAAAQSYSSSHNNALVQLYFPSGNWYLGNFDNYIFSNLLVAGDPSGQSVLVKSPNTGSWHFSTYPKNVAQTSWKYLSIARADDTAAHPAIPNNNYKGVNYVYLKSSADIQTLRNLGVPSAVSSGYAGLTILLASGATLGNNYGTQGTTPADLPVTQLTKDNGINPTPVNYGTVLAVDDTGKVYLKDNNRVNWGVDVHPQETLDQYYNPQNYSGYTSQSIVTGPAWVVPANLYNHDITFQDLVITANPGTATNIADLGGFFIGYAYNVRLKNIKFQNLPSYYPILTIRAGNVAIENSNFDVYSYQGIAFDSSSGVTVANSVFTGKSWPNYANYPNIPQQAVNFIALDEVPIDINLYNNQFNNLTYFSAQPSRSGQALNGAGGDFLKAAKNTFSSIDRAIFYPFVFNQFSILDSNSMKSSSALFYSGAGASNAHLFNNSYDTTSTVPGSSYGGGGGSAGFDSYNTNAANFFCKNYGISLNQWYTSNTSFPGNYYQNGQPITGSAVIQSSTTSYASVSTQLNPVNISSVQLSSNSIAVGSRADVTVNLSAPAPTDFPLYLMITGGDFSAANVYETALLKVPAGQQSATFTKPVSGMRPGVSTVSVRPLCSNSTATASADITITPKTANTTTLKINSGNNQQGIVGTTLPLPLTVLATDSAGNKVANASVQFTTTAGQLNPTTAKTDSNGIASTSLTLGTVTGTAQVKGSLTGVSPVTLSESAIPGPVARLSLITTPTQAPVGTPITFNAALYDKYGNQATTTTTPVIASVTGVSGTFFPSNTITPSYGQVFATFTPTTAGSATANLTVSGTSITVNQPLTSTSTVSQSQPQSLFTSQTPQIPSATDNTSYEMGMKFKASVAGKIQSVRYWKPSSETGSHVGRIWSTSGQLLATINFTNETASGWQTATLSTPLSLTANTTYIVSVNANKYFGDTYNAFTTAITNGNLTGIADGANGVYGTIGTFPNRAYANSNYFRDIVFQPN